MTNIPESGIKQACDLIVDHYGPKGRAQTELEKLHTALVQQLENTSDVERAMALKCEIAFLEGYMETPAAKIADIKAATKQVRAGA